MYTVLSLKQDQSCLARQAEVSGSWWHFARNVMAIYVPWSNTKVGHKIELCKFSTTKEEPNSKLSLLLRKCGHTYVLYIMCFYFKPWPFPIYLNCQCFYFKPWPFPIYFTCQLIVIHSLHTQWWIGVHCKDYLVTSILTLHQPCMEFEKCILLSTLPQRIWYSHRTNGARNGVISIEQ